MTQLNSPSRRVLGDKTTNASIRPQHSIKTVKNPTLTRDSLSVSYGLPTHSSRMSMLFKSPRAGRKRRIDEVEDAEKHGSQQSTDTQRLSEAGDWLSDESSHMDDMMVDSMSHSKSTAQTSLTSFHASQTEQEPAEVQFEIPDEMSQRTLDKMHEVSLPQNTSQPAALLRPNLLKETSQLSVSMSSLIDFDQDRSSQPSDGLQMIEPVDRKAVASTAQAQKSEEDARRDLLAEVRLTLPDTTVIADTTQKADTLRTRLQLAFYKVQTNQTSKPFSRLNRLRPQSPELPPVSSSPVSSPPQRNIFNTMSPESKIAIARARATMQSKPPIKQLIQITHPSIIPTAFSSRNTNEPFSYHIPSSPPLSNAAEVPTTVRPSTPSPISKSKTKAKTGYLPATPMQLSSPPGSPDQINTMAKKLKVEEKSRYGGLTSSVVKGQAATGLLELMRGGKESTIEEEAVE